LNNLVVNIGQFAVPATAGDALFEGDPAGQLEAHAVSISS
jgi:hypothetical protein